MTEQDLQKVQSVLNGLYLNKIINKASDAQLAIYEKLAVWRNSEDNKKKNTETSMKTTALFTMEEVKQIRDEFYYGEPTTIESLNQKWGSRVAHRNFSFLLSNASYKVDQWTYPDLEDRKNQWRVIRDQKYIEDILTGMGPTNFSEKWGCTYGVYHRLAKKIGYKTKRNGNRRPNV
jgi:hypothetical protein